MDNYLKDLAQQAAAPALRAMNNTAEELTGNAAKFATAQITSVNNQDIATSIAQEAAQQTAAAMKAVSSALSR